MRRTLLALLALVAVAACGAPRANLMVSPNTPAPVAELLQRMPAVDSDQERDLARALFEMQPSALATLVPMIGSAAADDDAAARYAIEAVGGWAARPRADDTREVWADRLAAEMGAGRSDEQLRFLLGQLALVGGERVVPDVVALLDRDAVREEAVAALVAIGGADAGAAIVAALNHAADDHAELAMLLDAAAALEPVEARASASRALTSSDPAVRLAGARALAAAAEPRSRADLVEVVMRAESAERPPLAAAALEFALRVDDPEVGLATNRDLLTVADRDGGEALALASLRTMARLSPEAARAELAVRDPEDERVGAEMARLAAELAAAEEVRRARQAEAAEGFVPLFNGEDLTGWVGATDGYFVQDGAIVCDPRTGGNLYTEREYADFVLRFEFRLTPGANNGLGIRAPLEGDAAYVGMELQVLDDGALRHADLRPYQYHGSIYGVAAVERGHQRPVGEWNEQEVVADGRRVRVILNGAVVLDVDLDEVSTPETADGRDHPGLARASGHIGFLGHGSRVEYRNIRIRELDR